MFQLIEIIFIAQFISRATEGKHWKYLLQAEELCEGHQILPNGSRSSSKHAQEYEVGSGPICC